MCFACPHCNSDTYPKNSLAAKVSTYTEASHPCQNLCGNNAKLLGGYAGIAEGLAFANEFQGDSAPHGHGFVSLANLYQHATLEDIAKHIEANGKTAVDRILNFHCHLACEDHVDNDRHQRNLNHLEKGFHANYQTEKRFTTNGNLYSRYRRHE